MCAFIRDNYCKDFKNYGSCAGFGKSLCENMDDFECIFDEEG